MTVYIFRTLNTPADRDIERFATELEHAQLTVKLIDADSIEGVRLAELYDVLARPTVVLVRDDGQLVNKWASELPLVSDISSQAHV